MVVTVRTLFTHAVYRIGMAFFMTPPKIQSSMELRTEAPDWLAVVATLADLAFETDCNGRFTAFGPGKVLGQPAARLIGTTFNDLFLLKGGDIDHAAADFAAIFNTVCQECIAWQGNVRLLRLSPEPVTYRLSLAPRIVGGTVMGAYGLLFELPAAGPPPAEAAGGDGAGAPALLDHETRFWTTTIFTDELARRLDRLDVEEKPGTLLFLGFSRAYPQIRGAVAMRVAEELRDIVRPTDLLGRINQTTIALWCDGMDHLTGAERAARFCEQLPAILPEQASITAGVVVRWPGSADDPRTVLERAFVALRLADLATERQTEPNGAGAWRVWQED